MNTEIKKTEPVSIPAENLENLRASVDKLSKRAKRLGLAPMVVETGKETVKEASRNGIKFDRTYVEVTIVGESPVVPGGWKLISKVTPMESGENLLSTVPGEETPMEYKDADPRWCDHCHTKRKRNDVFVIEDKDGEKRIVGRNCLADYLGHKSAETILGYASYVFEIDEILNDWEEDEPCGGGGGGERGVDTDYFNKVAAVIIAKEGFISKREAYDTGKTPTTYDIANFLWGTDLGSADWRKSIRAYLDNDPAILKTAEKALEWARGLEDSEGYLYNLGVAARNPIVTRLTEGIMASLVPAYMRHVEKLKKEAEAAEKPKGRFLGEPKKRMEFENLRVVFMKTFDSHFGVSTLIKFEDDDHNSLSWFASSSIDTDPYWDAYDNEGRVSVRGTVKKHEEFRGTPTTALTRVALLS